jgi:hypothetical protein
MRFWVSELIRAGPRLGRVRQDSRLQRRAAIAALGLVLVVVTALVALWVDAVLSSSSHTFSDRLAEASAIIAGGTLLLALIAAVVAMMAYAAATGQPDLRLQVRFEFSHPNRPVFSANVDQQNWIAADRFKQTWGTISLRNDSGYPARNPAVIVRLKGMAFLWDEYSNSDEWVIIDFANTVGILSVQWDGGPNYSIHGHSTRALPRLNLDRLWHIPVRGKPALSFELLADGYKRDITVPVNFIVDEQPIFPTDEKDQAPDWL